MRRLAIAASLFLAVPAAAEDPPGDTFPDQYAPRLEAIDDYGEPERRPAWLAPEWLDDGMAPLERIEKTLSDDYGLDFFIAYSPQMQFGAWDDNSDNFAQEFDLIGEWRAFESDTFGKGRLQFWFLTVQTLGKNRSAEFQQGAGSAWELSDLDTGGSDNLNAIGMLWWDQMLFDDHVQIVAGKIFPILLVGVNRFLGDDRTEFNMATLVIDPVNTVNENRALGAFTKLSFAGFYASGLWVDADSNIRSIDFRSVDNGDYGWAGEVGWEGHFEGLGEGNYRAFMFHSDSTGTGKSGDKGTGGGFTFDQDLGDHLAMFMYFSRRSGRERALRLNYSTGLIYRKPFGLDHDQIGLGFSYGQPDGMGLQGRKDDQYGLELYWRMDVLDRLEVTPFMQAIIKPVDSSKDGRFIGGLRLRIYL
jgi:hypothetical protein